MASEHVLAIVIVATETRVLFFAADGEGRPTRLDRDEAKSNICVVDRWVVSTPALRDDGAPWVLTLEMDGDSRQYQMDSKDARALVDHLRPYTTLS